MKILRAPAILATLLSAAVPAVAQQFPAEVLHRIERAPAGGAPNSLIQASDGNFYGVAVRIESADTGAVFRLRLDGLMTVLHRFGSDSAPGRGLMQATDGNLYGMTGGGRYGFGAIFRMTLDGQFTVLHEFSGQPDGAYPTGTLIQGSDGAFYGVTYGGGAWNGGTAFRITPDGSVTVLHHFNVRTAWNEVMSPVLGLVEFAGAYYGIVSDYWSAEVYRLSLDGRTLTLVYSISLSDGDYSAIGLAGLPIKARDGNLYGVTQTGCKGNPGTFYRITPDGVATRIRELRGCSQAGATIPLMAMNDGSLLTAGYGSVRRLTPSGDLTTVRETDQTLGLFYAYGNLLQAADGKVYGITDRVIYRLAPKSLTPRVRVSRRHSPVQVSWQPIFAATSYTVRRTSATGQVMVLGQVSGTSFLDPSAVSGQRYIYNVTSTGQYGESDIVASSTASVIVNRSIAHDLDADGRADPIVYSTRWGFWKLSHSNGQPEETVAWGIPGDIATPGDYDGDGALDVTVFRPSTGTWFLRGIGAVQWGQPGDTPVPGDYDGDGVTDVAIYRRSAGAWYVRGKPVIVWGEKNDVPVPADFNGDGVTDIAVYRPSTGVWYVRGLATVPYGVVGDMPMPADYDGDGTADFAVFRRTNRTWYVRGQFAIQWGDDGDIPVTLDRDGDGRTELGVYRRREFTWFFLDTMTGRGEGVRLGISSDGTDVPIGRGLPQQDRVAARANRDYDQDGRDDVMMFRPSTGDWFIRRSSSASIPAQVPSVQGGIPVPADFDSDGRLDTVQFQPHPGTWGVIGLPRAWGTAGDIPLPADYDGDGIVDLAVFRPSSGVWHIQNVGSYLFGAASDIPVPADYNGDGITELAVYRAGDWFVRDAPAVRFGGDGDIPVPADYDGDGITDIAVFRPSTGTWWVRDQFTIQWGAAGDMPVPLDRDGDGRAELIVYRPSNRTWYFYNPATGVVESLPWVWGLSGDIPVGRGAYWTYR